jgi:hypothetical protein
VPLAPVWDPKLRKFKFTYDKLQENYVVRYSLTRPLMKKYQIGLKTGDGIIWTTLPEETGPKLTGNTGLRNILME